MQCKIFASRNRKNLEETINEWLKEHPVSPQSMTFQITSVYCEDPDSHIVEHTVVLFYVPMSAIW